ncbi:MarC family protein [Alloprevotella tannerae]|uniref:MarC family protein n=1 Tax=Alloprevotella tannerae TaxID=76122 RepID=UPI0035CF4FAF
MSLDYILSRLSWQQIASTFIILFAIIDILGSTPLIINLKKLDRPINAVYATLISTALLIGFFYAGDLVLKLFSVDIRSFAVAGAMILFLMAIEMILDIELFKNNGPVKDATLIPIVFPLIAGPGAFTTLLSLRAEYAQVNIIIGILLNMLWVFFVLKMTEKVNTYLGKGTIYIMRKFFGIILLAISVRMFMVNLAQLLQGTGTAG